MTSQFEWNINPSEPNMAHMEEAKEKEYLLNVQFLKTFSTPAGKEVLAWLQLHVLDAPTWWPSQPPEFGYFREGQNSLLRQIKDKITKAREYQESKK